MSFSMNKLTEKAQEAIVAAQRLAEERQHTQLEPEHLLHGARSPRRAASCRPCSRSWASSRERCVQQVDAALRRAGPRASGRSRSTSRTRFRRVFEAAQRRPSG